MTRVVLPKHLLRFKPFPSECDAGGSTVRELLEDLEEQFPGLSDYIVHENGSMRQHVNIFIDNRLIEDRNQLSDPVSSDQVVVIMQALSGG